MVANALELTKMGVGDLREQLLKQQSQNATLRERLTALKTEAASAGTIALTGLTIAAGATAAGTLDAVILGENIARVQPYARPSTVAGALTLAAAAYMESPQLAAFAGGMLAPAGYERGAALGLTMRGRLTSSQATQARANELEQAAAAQKAAA